MTITKHERAAVARSLHHHTPPDYRQRALERAAAIIEHHAADLHNGYAKHWSLVDAAVLREEAAKMKENHT